LFTSTRSRSWPDARATARLQRPRRPVASLWRGAAALLVLGIGLGLAPAAVAEPGLGPTPNAGGNGLEGDARGLGAPLQAEPLPSVSDAPAPSGSSVSSMSPAVAAPSPAEPEAPETGYRWRGPPAASPDWSGAARDAAYFAGYQVVGIAVLYAMPASISGWSAQDKEDYSDSKWHDHVTNPVVWDGDNWFINYALHPYWGAAYYVRARERGLGRGAGFWYSALLSAMWEYGAEAIAEPVSIEDLIITPVFGTLLGQYVFEPWRQSIRAKPGPLDGWDRTILALTDPLGAINATIDRWFGIKSTAQLQPFVGRVPTLRGGVPRALEPLPVPVDRSAWGLQLTVRW
jgi:hypothetical protein